MALSPRESAKFIAENSTLVKILPRGISILGDVVIKELDSQRLKPDNFSQNSVHPKPEDTFTLDWLFVVDTLNFCFWSKEGEDGWEVEGYSGYFALCAAINRALREKIDILNPQFYSIITEAQLRNILRSDTSIEIPLLKERLQCLHEVGEVLLEKFGGSFEHVVKQCDQSAKKLLQLIVDNFKCFRDEAEFKGRKVAFYKRAQILVGDIWACFKETGKGYFTDIDEITMFADYRVPQTLLWYEVLEYTRELNEKLKNNDVLTNGDVEEQEIRGCTIHAVELVKEYVNSRQKSVNSILLDHFLWDFRRKNARDIEAKGIPFHKVFCIYY